MDTFCGEAVSVTGTVTLDQSVTLEFAQVVAQLVQAVSSLGEMEGGEDGLMDLLGGPTADVSAAVQENLEQADDAHVVDFDAGIADRADGDGQRNALQQREVDVDVEPLGLVAGETAGDGLKRLADRIEMVQSFPQTEVVEVVGAEFVAQERRELFVLLAGRRA